MTNPETITNNRLDLTGERPPIRWELVLAVRGRIESGFYDDRAILTAVAERVAEALAK
jgi:hypothetical protein